MKSGSVAEGTTLSKILWPSPSSQVTVILNVFQKDWELAGKWLLREIDGLTETPLMSGSARQITIQQVCEL